MLTEHFRKLHVFIRQTPFETVYPRKAEIINNSLQLYKTLYPMRLPPATTAENQKLRDFFTTHILENFLWMCSKVLPSLTDTDLYSLGTTNSTIKAKILLDLLHVLESYGFEGIQDILNVSPPDSSVIFWSGDYAKTYVTEHKELLSDIKIPAFSMLFALCTAILRTQGSYDGFCLTIASAFSKMYVASAASASRSNVIKVFISSNKPSEIPGLEVTNNFWQAELAQLQLSEHIRSILVYRYDPIQNIWLPPIDLKMSDQTSELLIRRREFYKSTPSDRAEDIFKFKHYKSHSERQVWVSSEPRPSISYTRLKEIAQQWRAYKKKTEK